MSHQRTLLLSGVRITWLWTLACRVAIRRITTALIPMLLGLAVALNLTLNFSLMRLAAAAGVALATAVSAAIQTILLVAIYARRAQPLDWKPLFAALARSLAATLAMTTAVWLILRRLPAGENLWDKCLQVVAPLAGALAIYVGVFTAIGGEEWRLLKGRQDMHN